MKTQELREHIENVSTIEKISNNPKEKIIAGFLRRRLINKLIEIKFPKPKEL